MLAKQDYVIKYFLNHECGSDLSLFLACQRLNSEMNLRECEDQSWFKVQGVLCFVLLM
jgi:hypothetical protein